MIASVVNESGNVILIEKDFFKTKKDFADALRGNGYKVRFISFDGCLDQDAIKYNERLRRNRLHNQIIRKATKIN